MKTCILFLLLSFWFNGDILSQKDELVFEYLKKKVRRVKMSQVECIDMTYHDGVIIGKEYRNGPLVERRFYYTEIGRLDSMKWLWGIGGEEFVVNKYYDYDQEGKLEKVERFVGADGEMFDLDLYQYDATGRIDSIFSWRNYSTGTFSKRKVIPLHLTSVNAMSYDSLKRLTRKDLILGLSSVTYELYTYNEEGRVSTATKYSSRSGESHVMVTKFKYNKLGLPIKENSRYYKKNQRGELKLYSGGFPLRWRYIYYK